jgi:hypothetical protein
MRKLFIVMSFIFAISAIEAQIKIESKHMPKANDTARLSIASPTGLPTGWQKTGGTQNWDFSKIRATGTQLRDFKASARTPYAFYFFNQIGEKVIDTLGAGPLLFTNIFNFYTKSNTVFKAEGLGYSATGIPLASKYSDDDEIYQFPLEYNDSDVSTFRFKFEIPGQQFFTYVQQGKRTNVVDAYGSVTTPFKTYNNVLRVKTIMDQTDSLVTAFVKTPIPRPQVIYKWLSAQEIVPVLEIRGTRLPNGTFTITEVYYKDSLTGKPNDNTGFMHKFENPESCTQVFPNPATDRLSVQFVCPTLVAINFPETIKVYNEMGQTFEVHLVRESDEMQYYSVSHLPQGLYQLQFMGMAAHFVKI